MERVSQMSGKDTGKVSAGTETVENRGAVGRGSLTGQWTEMIALAAVSALYDELSTHPKPGLVSFKTNGSHSDMTCYSFLSSINALYPWFCRFAEAGKNDAELSVLQELGIVAEEEMLLATGGVNTHRGAIFLLGLLCAAAGCEVGDGRYPPFSFGQLGRNVAVKWGGDILPEEDSRHKSNGMTVFQKYGVRGARAEAISGFANVYEYGLPAFISTIKNQAYHNASLQAFYALLREVRDTTLYHRGGSEGQEFATESAVNFLDSGGVFESGWELEAQRIHEDFVKRNLSAGGIADLLSATLFIYSMEETE